MNVTMLHLTHLVRIVLLMLVVSAFHACIDNKYDLDKDLSLEVTVGGNHLSIPLGSTSKTYLDSLVDVKDGDVLQFLENGNFAFSKADSLDIKMPKIDPVNITVNGLNVEPISVTVGNVQLPEIFNIGDFTKNIPLGADNIQLSVKAMDPIVINAQKQLTEGQNGTPIPPNTSASLAGLKEFDFSFDKVPEIKEINTIYFGSPDAQGTLAEITVHLPENINATIHSIENFSVTLPSGFTLTRDPASIAGSINDNTFTVTNYNPGQNKTIRFSFYVQKMSGNFTSSAQDISYGGDVQYALTYKVNAGTFIREGASNVSLDINIPLMLKNADISTNDIGVELDRQNIGINSKIENIPEEIASVRTIYFDASANEIAVKISELELPVSLSGNDIQLKFPETFHFAASDRLSTGNILKITPVELSAGTTKILHLESMDLNQTVTNQVITLNNEIVFQPVSLILDETSSVNTKDVQTLSDKEIQVRVSGENLKISHANLTSKGITIDVDPAETDMNISEKTPEELIAIQDVTFKQDVEIKLQLSFEGIPASIEKIRLKDYTVTFPDFIVFNGDDVRDHQLVLNEEFKVSEGFSKTLTIDKFSFGNENPIKDGYIVIEQTVNLAGQIYIGESDLNSDELKNIIVKPTLDMNSFELSVVTGKINPDIQPEHERINMGDIPDFLKDADVVLDLQHPVITVSAANTVGVPVKTDLNIQPKLNGKTITAGVVNASIAIPAAKILGEPSWSNFWISDAESGMPSDFQFVNTPNLPNLIRKIPDSIAITMNAMADPDALHMIDLSIPEYKLKVKYNISVPLQLGSDLAIIYNDTIDDFHKDIEDYTKYVSEVLIFTEIENTVPLEMECDIQVIDVNKKVLTGISVSAPEKIKAAGWNPQQSQETTVTTTSFPVTLKETVKGELSKLDGLTFKISAKANSTVAGATLNKNQYIKVSAKMKVPGGITVDIDDL